MRVYIVTVDGEPGDVPALTAYFRIDDAETACGIVPGSARYQKLSDGSGWIFCHHHDGRRVCVREVEVHGVPEWARYDDREHGVSVVVVPLLPKGGRFRDVATDPSTECNVRPQN
ncbi:MAG TPA: hypothetical protein VKU87_08225 [Thermomicrobiaceae bacterium]|nr:hypothetical protein [Thermomicrobiaceae bacterium]